MPANEDRSLAASEVEGSVFRIGPAYVDRWLHEPSHWVSARPQELALDSLRDALMRLLRFRDAVQQARGVFGPVSVFYPDNYPSSNQQDALHRATADYFQHFYVTVDKLNTVLQRHPDVFTGVPHRSVSRFLDWLRPMALFADEAIPFLRSARNFRTLIDHASQYQAFGWHTFTTEDMLTRIVFVGLQSTAGKYPDGAERISGSDDPFSEALASTLYETDDSEQTALESDFAAGWYYVAPDEDLTTWALCVQLNALIMRIAARRDNSAVITCPWGPTLTGDDVRLDYPTFAVEDGVVVGTWSTEFKMTANVSWSADTDEEDVDGVADGTGK